MLAGAGVGVALPPFEADAARTRVVGPSSRGAVGVYDDLFREVYVRRVYRLLSTIQYYYYSVLFSVAKYVH